MQTIDDRQEVAFSQIEQENSELVDALVDGVRQYNIDKLGKETSQPLTIVAHDQAGKLIGGVHGRTIYKNFLIHVLWVDDNRRGAGLGRQLMIQAEQLAKARGCLQAQVDTLEVQAPDFYRKLGFNLAGQVPAFEGSPARYFMVKRYDTSTFKGDDT